VYDTIASATRGEIANMDLLLLLAADYAAVDASGKLNILGAFRTIYAPRFPTTHPLMHLIIKLRPDSGEYGIERSLRIVLVDEDGNELFNLENSFSVPMGIASQRPEFNAVLGLRDIKFEKPGTYEFRVFVDKDQKGTFALDVIKVEPPQQPEG
jgi:hypothetical protein